jgi:hypothetical protein
MFSQGDLVKYIENVYAKKGNDAKGANDAYFFCSGYLVALHSALLIKDGMFDTLMDRNIDLWHKRAHKEEVDYESNFGSSAFVVGK